MPPTDPIRSILLDIIQEHHHNWENWFGAAVVPAGTTHRADRVGITQTPFVPDAGNDDWGAWLQLLGSIDTPVRSGNLAYDMHRIYVVAAEVDNVYFAQFAFGSSGAIALAAGNYSDFIFSPVTPGAVEIAVDLRVNRVPVGTPAWVRIMAPTQDTATLSFYLGLHEYDKAAQAVV